MIASDSMRAMVFRVGTIEKAAPDRPTAAASSTLLPWRRSSGRDADTDADAGRPPLGLKEEKRLSMEAMDARLIPLGRTQRSACVPNRGESATIP